MGVFIEVQWHYNFYNIISILQDAHKDASWLIREGQISRVSCQKALSAMRKHGG